MIIIVIRIKADVLSSSFDNSQSCTQLEKHDLILEVESEDIELEFTENLNLNAGDVIDNNGNSDSDLDLDSDRDVNLNMNLDTTSNTFSNSSNILETSPGQMESEDPIIVLNKLRGKNSERLIIAHINKWD